MGPGCPPKPTGRWPVSSHVVLGVRKVEWGTPLDSLVLGPKGEGSGRSGPGHPWLPGYWGPWSLLDVDIHLNSLLSRKLLSSPGFLVKAKGAYAQAGEGILPHPGLLTFISPLI